jgi:hypothetical protein
MGRQRSMSLVYRSKRPHDDESDSDDEPGGKRRVGEHLSTLYMSDLCELLWDSVFEQAVDYTQSTGQALGLVAYDLLVEPPQQLGDKILVKRAFCSTLPRDSPPSIACTLDLHALSVELILNSNRFGPVLQDEVAPYFNAHFRLVAVALEVSVVCQLSYADYHIRDRAALRQQMNAPSDQDSDADLLLRRTVLSKTWSFVPHGEDPAQIQAITGRAMAVVFNVNQLYVDMYLDHNSALK